MNPTISALPLQPIPRQPVKTHERRRVYLDTYAQKRGVSTPTVQNQVISVSQPSQVPVSTGTAMPMFVNPVAPMQSQANTHLATGQPTVALAQPNPIQKTHIQAPAQVPQQQIAPTQIALRPAQTRPETTQDYLRQVRGVNKNYLDTIKTKLTPTHQQSSPALQQVAQVALAPAPVVTVTKTLNNAESQKVPQVHEQIQAEAQDQAQVSSTFDEKHIEANLRVLYQDEASLTQALMKDNQSASLSHMRTIVASAFACGVIAVSMFSFLSQTSSQPVVAHPVGSPVIEVEAPVKQPVAAPAAATGEPNRVAINPNYPARLVIGGIGVNAPIQAVGQTPEGLMEVPKSYGIVGWYSKGVYPGQKGPAVMAGHYTGGYGGVFDRLADLKDGDLITTTNGKGESLTYKVVKKVEYHKDQVPMAELFKTGDSSRLEIITCAGKWQSQNYDKRLVVTAELVR